MSARFFDRALLTTYLAPEWPRALLLGVLLISGIGLQLANPQIAKTFIDHAQAGQSVEKLIWLALLYIGVALLTQAASVAETFVAEDLGWRTTNVLRADLTRHVLELDGSFHGEHTPGELIERIDGDVSAIAGFFARFVVQVLGSSLALVGVLALLVREDWRVGAVMGLSALSAMVLMLRGGGFVAVRSKTAREAAAEVTSYVEEQLGGLADVKSSGADGYALRGLQQRLGARFRGTASAVLAGSLFNASVETLLVVGAGAALALSVGLFSAGVLTLGSIYAVFRYTTMLRPPLERLSREMNAVLQATGAIVRVRELLATIPAVRDIRGNGLPSGALAVEVQDVWFAYEADPVLSGVSLRLAPGQVLGLLGRTGSGKTTLSRLLFRLYDPSHGAIRVGGADLRAVSLDAVRQRVGLVTQDVQLIQATLRDNVTWFDPGVDDGRITNVFAELGLEEWLRALPDGLDTRLGAGGRGLSAGEAQLVALARVFLKDPGLVVLDEASSRLDPMTESLLERAIERLLAGRTGVIIAHRLATVDRADQVAILASGRVVEVGARTDLAVDPGSRYSHLRRVGLAEVLA